MAAGAAGRVGGFPVRDGDVVPLVDLTGLLSVMAMEEEEEEDSVAATACSGTGISSVTGISAFCSARNHVPLT